MSSKSAIETGEHEQLQELSELVRQEEERKQALAPVPVLPALHEVLDDLVKHVERRECAAVFVFDASRLAAWERQYGSSAFDKIIQQLCQGVLETSRVNFGPETVVCVDALGGDSVLVFPVKRQQRGESTFIDLEDQLHQMNLALLEEFASFQLWFHEAIEAIASGSSVILQTGPVDPRRTIYRAIRKAHQDARIAHGESQRRRNRIVGHVIAHQKLRTLFQPIVDLSSTENKVFGYEALSRPLAREARKLGVHLFVAASRAELDGELDATCRALSVSRRPQLAIGEHLFINCLPPTFYDGMNELEQLLDEWEAAGMRPEQLVFEVTESITRKQVMRIMRNVSKLRDRGYRFALDDVGTGTSNLQLLAELEPHFIKMDMSLTIGIARSERKRKLASYLLELSRRCDAALIAEGIETREDLEILRDLGVDLGQGYLLGRPEDAALN